LRMYSTGSIFSNESLHYGPENRSTVVLPYPLIEYPRITAARNKENWKVKEMNGS
jgi:hypothetical protein